MKTFFIVVVIISLWINNAVSQNLLRYPESAAYYNVNDCYYVSNQETGTIVKINANGDQEVFTGGMETTIGLEIYNDTIYAVGNNEIFGFSLSHGLQTFYVKVNGAIKLNDITLDNDGNIYSSDVLGNKIYKISRTDSSYQIIASNGITGPNGILYEEDSNRLLICFWGQNASIKSLDLSTFVVNVVANLGLSNCDGIAKDIEGNYYVSEWAGMSIHKYDSQFNLPGEVIYTDNGAPADIFYNHFKNEIAIPLVLEHKLDIVKLASNSETGKIVFYSGRDGNNEVYIMNADGSLQTNLTNNPASDLCPAISSDGDKIVFLSNRDSNQDIYLIDIDGTNIQRLTTSTVPIEHPSWSYDCSKIYFIKDYGNRTEIWRMNYDGSNQQQLTNNNARDERPFLSPDGTTILFMSNRNGNYEIYTMNIDGSNQTRITNTSVHEIFPVWSPNGNKIAYSQNYFINGVPQAEIHICNPDGSEDITLTNSSGRDENPAWSPDGDLIVFQSERDGNFELYSMSIDGSNQTRLTNSPQWDGWASWANYQINSVGWNNKLPEKFNLYQNYPNPFNSSTLIKFRVIESGLVSLNVFDILGNEVETILSEEKSPGSYTVKWDATNLSSGIYFYSFRSTNSIEIKKMCLIK